MVFDNSGGGSWSKYINIPITTTPSEYAQYKVVIDSNNVTVYSAEGTQKTQGDSGITSDFWNNVKSDGSDIRVFNQNKEQRYFWIEEFDYDNNRAVIWVKVEAGDTELNIAYGNPNATTSVYNKPNKVFEVYDDFKNYAFTKLPDLPRGMADLTSAILNGKIYLIGGYGTSDTEALDTVYVFDPSTQTYTQVASLNYARWGAIAVAYNGKIYVFGGIDGSKNPVPYVEVYDPNTDTWTVLNNTLPSELQGQGQMAVTDGQYIYIYYDRYLYRYDPSTDSYTLLDDNPPVYVARWGAMALYNNKIYILCGSNPSEYLNEVMWYDLSTGTWHTGTPAPHKVHGVARENPIIGDKIYIAGGIWDSYSDANFADKLLIYDISEDKWYYSYSGFYKFDGGTVAVYDNKLYIFGGRNVTSNPYGLKDAEVYDPSAPDAISYWEDINIGWIRDTTNEYLKSTSANAMVRYSNFNDVGNYIYEFDFMHLSTSTNANWLWFMFKTSGTSGTYQSGDGYGVLFYLDSGGYVRFAKSSGGSVTFTNIGPDSNTAQSAKTWHHAKIVYNSGTIEIYLDDKLIYTTTDTDYNSGEIRFRDNDKGYYHAIDNVRILKYADPADFGTPTVKTLEETGVFVTNEDAYHGNYSCKFVVIANSSEGEKYVGIKQSQDLTGFNEVKFALKITELTGHCAFEVWAGNNKLAEYTSTIPNWEEKEVDVSSISGTQEVKFIARAKDYTEDRKIVAYLDKVVKSI